MDFRLHRNIHPIFICRYLNVVRLIRRFRIIYWCLQAITDKRHATLFCVLHFGNSEVSCSGEVIRFMGAKQK